METDNGYPFIAHTLILVIHDVCAKEVISDFGYSFLRERKLGALNNLVIFYLKQVCKYEKNCFKRRMNQFSREFGSIPTHVPTESPFALITSKP